MKSLLKAILENTFPPSQCKNLADIQGTIEDLNYKIYLYPQFTTEINQRIAILEKKKLKLTNSNKLT